MKHLETVFLGINDYLFTIYLKFFVINRQQRQVIRQYWDQVFKLSFSQTLLKCWHMKDLDEFITMPLHKHKLNEIGPEANGMLKQFDSLEAYQKRYSGITVLQEGTLPESLKLVIFLTKDDVVVGDQTFKCAYDGPGEIWTVVTEHGGHVGYFEKGDFAQWRQWSSRTAV